MPANQPILPGLTPRGRPRSILPRTERIRTSQAERRKNGLRKTLSAEVDGDVLADFKAAASVRLMTIREAVEEAMKNWIKSTPPKSHKSL